MYEGKSSRVLLHMIDYRHVWGIRVSAFRPLRTNRIDLLVGLYRPSTSEFRVLETDLQEMKRRDYFCDIGNNIVFVQYNYAAVCGAWT